MSPLTGMASRRDNLAPATHQTDALRLADTRATVILLGAAGISNVDLTSVWFKELLVAGSFCHSNDGGAHSIDRALGIMATGGFPGDLLVTHRFPLEGIREAVATAGDRAAGAIKVVLQP